jgi:cobalt/nickel transport system permease protein
VALPAMLGVHALIGIGEGLITAAAVALVQSSRPDLLEGYEGSDTRVEGLAA